jgi:hypothetical protein
MNGLDAIAMNQLTRMPERHRRTTDETSGRFYARVAGAIRRLRPPAVRRTVLQPETSAR